jgi:hypothetical protein
METHSNHPQTLTGKKTDFSFFSEIHPFLDRLDEKRPKTAKMVSKPPEMVLKC